MKIQLNQQMLSSEKNCSEEKFGKIFHIISKNKKIQCLLKHIFKTKNVLKIKIVRQN